MTAPEALEAFRSRFPEAAVTPPDPAPRAIVEPEGLRDALEFLRDRLGFGYLVFMTAIDRIPESRIELVYRLFSYESRTSVVLRVEVPREAAKVPSVADLFRTADWHEREAAEMFGAEFIGHPDPRRLLLDDDIVGYPLRKDFTHPNMIPLPEVK